MLKVVRSRRREKMKFFIEKTKKQEIHNVSQRSWVLWFPMIFCILFFCLNVIASEPFQPLRIPEKGYVLLPDSERHLNRVVIGLEPLNLDYYLLPETTIFDEGYETSKTDYIRRQVYWLNFEFTHGSIMTDMPANSVFFVAVPDPLYVLEASGTEDELFRSYLSERLRWSEDDIRKRIRFFKAPAAIIYLQDIGEVIGYDRKGRTVLGIGVNQVYPHLNSAVSLARSYPDDFVICRLGELSIYEGIDPEGGDLSLVWLPDGKLGLIIGRHRVLRYLETKYEQSFLGQVIPFDLIEETREHYSKAFFNLETIIAGEEALTYPHMVSDELFHLDMIVNIVRKGSKTVAFVPTYEQRPIDADTNAPLNEELWINIQREYDMTSKQLENRGYEVVRLPFRDNPVRNPVNAIAYIEPETGTQTVMLGKFPRHIPSTKETEPDPNQKLLISFEKLNTAVEKWAAEPSEKFWNSIEPAFKNLWTELHTAPDNPNPDFLKLKGIYESHGVKVIEVANYPAGEGGLHCLVLK